MRAIALGGGQKSKLLSQGIRRLAADVGVRMTPQHAAPRRSVAASAAAADTNTDADAAAAASAAAEQPSASPPPVGGLRSNDSKSAHDKKSGGSNNVRKPPRAPSFAADAKGSPFDGLKLIQLTEGMGKVRVRQHVNPLRAEYQQPIGPVDWSAAFDDPTLPLVVDLGCGPGRYLLLLERRAAEGKIGLGVPDGGRCNYLGVEIRRPLVDRANEWARQLGCQGRVHFLFANATVSLSGMLEGYPGQVAAFYTQFPDPHFKRRHRKRRLLQPDTVRAMARALPPGGLVFLQSDVLRAAEGLRDAVEAAAAGDFELHPLHSEPGRTFEARSPGGNADSSGGFAGAAGAAAQGAGGGGDAAPADGSWEFGTVSDDGASSNDEGGGGGGAGGGGEDDDDDEGEDGGGGVFVSEWAKGGWLRDNPVGVPTEREYYVAETQGADIYRVLLVKR